MGPLMPTEFGTPAHWRMRAPEARNMARHIADPTAKRGTEEIAANYRKVANVAEAKLRREQ